MKKIFAVLLSLTMAFSLCAACADPAVSDNSGNSSNPKEEEIEIDVPGGQELTPLPEPPDMPAKPTLPAPEEGKAPYIGAMGSSTDAYATENLSADSFAGVKVSYPAAGKQLADYQYLWFDVYNYTPDYHYLRFDFEEIAGAEKVAVSAHYLEGYDSAPPVGVLVESLMDGSLSFVSNLSQFYTLDNNYKEGEDLLSAQTICRLFVYFDSNPAQHPSDAEGSVKVSGIRFLKEGDPDIAVDNSPKISGVTSSGTGYTLTTPETDSAYEGLFRAAYTPKTVSADAYVSVGIDRFTGAYGRIRLSYRAENVEKLTITDGRRILKGGAEGSVLAALDGFTPAGEGTLVLDIRGWSALKELRFYLDSKSAGESETAAAFEITALELVYTPYVTEEWDSTSKFHLEDAALGGKVKATYEVDVGYDYVHVPVKNWTPDYSQMVVKFKTSGTAQGDKGAERYGLSVNSNKVLLEVAYNKVSDLPYDETTGEYTMKVNLTGITKLATLNFYFDSINIEPFAGTRTVEFTSIEFTSAAPELSVGPIKAYNGFTVTKNDDGSTDIEWAAGKEAAFTGIDVAGWNSDYAQFSITVENTGSEPVKLGVYIGWSVMWMDHTEIPVGAMRTFTVPVLNPDKLDSFELALFWNYPANNAGSVKVSDVKFLKTIAVGTMYDVASAVGSAKEYNIAADEAGTQVSWAAGRSQWAKTAVNVAGFDTAYRYLRLDFSLTRPTTIGVWHHVDMNDPAGVMWLTHTAYEAGTHTIYIPIAEGDVPAESFLLFFYFDSASAQVAEGSVTFTNISFALEKPAEETLIVGAMYDIASSLGVAKEYDVTSGETGTTVSWAAGRSQYAKACVDVSGFDGAKNGWLKLEFTVSRDMQIGVFVGNAAWLPHTAYTAGTHTVYVQAPASPAAFTLEFYFDAIPSVTEGSVTFANISFAAEKPAA